MIFLGKKSNSRYWNKPVWINKTKNFRCFLFSAKSFNAIISLHTLKVFNSRLLRSDSLLGVFKVSLLQLILPLDSKAFLLPILYYFPLLVWCGICLRLKRYVKSLIYARGDKRKHTFLGKNCIIPPNLSSRDFDILLCHAVTRRFSFPHLTKRQS